MLEALGNSLRSFRTTIVAGGIWVTALFVALHPYSDNHDFDGVIASLREIEAASPSFMPLVGLILSAYVVGVVSEALLGSLGRSVSRLVLRAQRSGVHPFAREEIGTLNGFLESAQGRSRARFAGSRDRVRITHVHLQAKAPALAREVLVLREEAALRLQLLPPLLALSSAVALHLPWGWSIAIAPGTLLAFIALAASANHRAESANDVMDDWQAAGSPELRG